MKSFRYLVIILCLLMYCEIYAQGKVEKGPVKHGEFWNSWTEDIRGFYLLGLRDGIVEGRYESLRLSGILKKKGYITHNEGLEEQFDFFLDKTLSENFPEIDVVGNVMTKFYADPSNTYLSFPSVFLISVAKIRGASPWLIEKMLATARKAAYELKYSLSLREIFYEEFLKLK